VTLAKRKPARAAPEPELPAPAPDASPDDDAGDDTLGLDALTHAPTHVVVGHSRGYAWVRPMTAAHLPDFHSETVRYQCRGNVRCVVGDRIALDAENMVCGVAPRVRTLRRAVGPKVKVLCANVDQMVLVMAVGKQLREGFLMRGLVACALQSIPALVVLNKVDLDDGGLAQEEAALWRTRGVQVVCTSAESGLGLEELEKRLANGVHALMGHSGVGKSTLINRLRPGANRRTGGLDWQGKGKHITTMAEAILMPDSMLIDLPGIRELGLFNATEDSVLEAFPDVREAMTHCRFQSCKHADDSEGCGVTAAMDNGHLDPLRVDLCFRMQQSVAAGTEGGGRY
jgi:ribosome biogenesis GTPase